MKQKTVNHRSITREQQQPCLTHRRGTIVLIPMLCLVLSLAVIGGLLKQTSIELKQLKKEQFLIQANWLADAAAQRAARKLREEQNYTGETWTVLPEELGGKFPGSIVIEINRSPQNNQPITIRTLASYPSKGLERVRIVREWPSKLSNTTTKN